MFSNLDSVRGSIVPHYVASGVREVPKESTLLRINHELGTASARRMNPDTASKGAEASEVIHVSSRKLMWGLASIFSR